jgi:hypothetical protein
VIVTNAIATIRRPQLLPPQLLNAIALSAAIAEAVAIVHLFDTVLFVCVFVCVKRDHGN